MKEVIKLSAFSAIASMLLLSSLRPFGMQAIKDNQFLYFTTQAFFIFVASVIALTIMRFVFNVRLDRVRTRKELTKTLIYYHLAAQPFIALMMLIFISWIYPINHDNPIYCDGEGFTARNIIYMNLEVLVISAMLLILEIFMYGNTLLQQELEQVKSINSLLEERQEEYAKKQEETSVEETVVEEPTLCKLTGGTKDSVLELDPRNIVYVEAMSNYADICYIENEEVKHKTMRITLRQIQETFTNIDFIVPTHRAFLVNLNFVVAIAGQASVGFHLQMFGLDKEIPVSRSNTRYIKEKLAADCHKTVD